MLELYFKYHRVIDRFRSGSLNRTAIKGTPSSEPRAFFTNNWNANNIANANYS